MHTKTVRTALLRRRSPAAAVLAMGLLGALTMHTPLDVGGIRALLIKNGGDAVREQFTVTLDRAAESYRDRAAALTRSRTEKHELQQSARELAALMAEKRDVRLAIAAAQRSAQALHAVTGLPATDAEAQADAAMAPMLTALSAAYEPPLLRGPGAAFAAALEGRSAITALQDDFDRSIARELAARQSHLMLIARVTDDDVAALRTRHADLLAQTATAADAYDTSAAALARAEGNARTIQGIMRDVHDHVLQLQAQMERIDAQLRERAERQLLAKGLIDPSAVAATRMAASAPDLRWPAYGRISGGYLDVAYQETFGVPHHGIDIAVNDGTQVRSAADGIVFLVRDGGDTGYTYVLIGHRGGVATLYGHLQAVGVAAGQEVSAGQVIGLSGGRPGTPGAGPMTTASHLHFEVIRQGANVNPLDALPSL